MQYLISANVEKKEGYNIVGAFEKFSEIDWHKVPLTQNIQVGDLVYIYVSRPYAQIKYKCICIDNNVSLENRINDIEFYNDKHDSTKYKEFYRLLLMEKYNDECEYYAYKTIKALGLIGDVNLRWTIRSDKYPKLFDYLGDYEAFMEHGWFFPDESEEAAPSLILAPRPRKAPSIVNGKERWEREASISRNVLRLMNHTCEINDNHTSFIRKNSTKPYMEPHHLIPMRFSYKYEVSLDVEANIVCLCSNCHNHIHYGEGAEFLIEKLYIKRKEMLEKCGIRITLEELLNLYGYY